MFLREEAATFKVKDFLTGDHQVHYDCTARTEYEARCKQSNTFPLLLLVSEIRGPSLGLPDLLALLVCLSAC